MKKWQTKSGRATQDSRNQSATCPQLHALVTEGLISVSCRGRQSEERTSAGQVTLINAGDTVGKTRTDGEQSDLLSPL
ncbi:hypothetical protein BaRGS_00004153 [Batillaria attramentaria]|uniref:Uncharacterized protein n=1 Tax=Batillaria attramentaria TaxID=370345 RepID=A0ABD0LZ21_9CAEN